MCLAVYGKVKKIDLPFAVVDVKGIETCVNVQLIENISKGEYVLVHAGFAIEKVNKEYCDDLDDIFENMLKEDDDFDT